MTAVYVYGVVPADVEVKPGRTGVGDPPGALATVAFEDIAALVSEVDPQKALGTADDLRTHAAILDSTAAVAPVLPLRFGAVMTDTEAVVSELLEPHRDEFREALDKVDGFVQYVVKGRYVEDAVLREILTEDHEVVRLRDILRSQPEETTRDQRLALGERIGNAIAAKRDVDSRRLADTLGAVATSVSVREPTHDEDAGTVSVLVAHDDVDAFDQAVSELADDWQGRVDLTVSGPLAAYDFVEARVPGR